MKKPKPYFTLAPWSSGWGYKEPGGGITTCYRDVSDAELWVERLNRAYELGRKHALKEQKTLAHLAKNGRKK